MSLNAAANFVDKRLDERSTVVDPQPNTNDTMLALVWHGNKNVKVERVPLPTITEPDDVVCRVTGTTVCGSDLHLYHKEIMELRDGDILGHEWMGIVEKVGPGVRNFKVGDRVVASFQIACGNCEYCKALNTSMCKNTNKSRLQEKFYGQAFAGIYGYSHFTGGYPGGQAEYVRAPKADYNLLKIPASVPDEKALYLSDIVPTSYHAVQYAEVTKGKSVAIWGLGPIGLCAAKWSLLAGARRVICIDTVDYRLEKAKSLGCDVIDFKKENDVVAAIQNLEPEGVDCSIDAAGFRFAKNLLHKVERVTGLETDSPENINEALRATKKFGTISLVADYVGLANHVMVGALMEKGITLRGTGQAPVQKYWHQLLKKIEHGEFDPTFILSHRFSLTDFEELYEAFDLKNDEILKVFVETKFSKPPAAGTPALSTLS